MNKQLRAIGAIIIISFWGFGSVYGTGNKSTELKLKLDEITDLQQSLSGKIELASEKKLQLEQKTETLKREIIDQKDELQIDNYQRAILNPRIDYNLKLIQLLNGYISRLKDKITYFQIGQDTLSFFYRQAQDDLLMIKTLNDLEIDKLIAQINDVLDEYIPETGKPLFDVNDVPLQDTRQIWDEIARKTDDRASHANK
jgi:uncharacterized membrane protein YheB (UPF0754 family)